MVYHKVGDGIVQLVVARAELVEVKNYRSILLLSGLTFPTNQKQIPKRMVTINR